MDYTAVGQTTHLAARMEQLAEPGTTLLTPGTLALAEDFVQVKSLGRMRVKGLNETIEAYELLAAHPARSRFQAHAARGLTKFVGRTGEIAQLAETLDRARNDRGRASRSWARLVSASPACVGSSPTHVAQAAAS